MTNAPPDFRQLFEAAPGLFVLLSSDFTILTASDAYLSAGKMSRDQVVGKNLFATFPDHADHAVKASLEEVLKTKKTQSMQGRKYTLPVPASEGGGVQTRYWTSTNVPFLDANGDVTHIVRRVEDVTDFKNVEHERDLFFTFSFDLMAIVGNDGYFKKVNPAFEHVMGYTEKELYDRPIVTFLHPEDVEKTKKGIKTLSTGMATRLSVNRYLCKDGSYKCFQWNTTPDGAFFYSVGRDITEQTQHEAHIKDLNQQLEEKNHDLEKRVQERLTELTRSEAQVMQLQKMDAIGRLAGGIAHDINNMLGAVSLYCDMLMDSAGDNETVTGHVVSINEVTQRAATLTKQLLVFSRKQIVQLKNVDLNPLIKTMEKMLARLIGENVRIHLKLHPDLKSVSVDAPQFEQVIMNLVVNARDALPQGGNITIETQNIYLDEQFTSKHLSVDPGNYVMICVADDGFGMDAETANRIFEPFFTTKPIGKGTGLGLTTTYGIIKQSKGTIWVYSEPGKGTVFKIYLPVSEKPAEKAEPVSVKPVVTGGGQTILLVEDDEMLREGFHEVLEHKGYKVLVASHGKEAVNICETYADVIHMMLTDVVMPGMGGFEVAKKAFVIRPDMKILFMSGYTDDTLETAGLDHMGPLNFIQKPFGVSALMNKVKDVLHLEGE